MRLAEPLVDGITGEVLFEAGHVFKHEDYDKMLENDIDNSD